MSKTYTKHIILGAGGSIGKVLARELLARSESVKLVSRSGTTLPGAESARADLTDLEQTRFAVEDSSIVYLLPGLPYVASIWEQQWPKIIKNAVEACQQAKGARLIFFDNVYAYGKVDGPMTEDSPHNPCSRKGEVRASIADFLLSEIKKQNITATIARAADFYGPYADKNSIPFIFVFDKLLHAKKPQCLVNGRLAHSYTFTGDCGKALYLLANAEDSFNQVWHLPTARPALTGEEFIRIAAEKFGARPDYTVMPKWMVRLGGLFNQQVREVYEMLYQNEYAYQFDSSKFESRFNFATTSYEKGIAQTIAQLRAKANTTS